MAAVKSNTKGRKKITLVCDADPGCDVFVAGTFNNWDPTQKRMKAGDGNEHYRSVLMLPRGEHEYKFVIDGAWRLDECNPQWKPNGLGSLNSVVNVG